MIVSHIDRILSIEENQINRNKEIDRILTCFKYDYFEILEIEPGNIANSDLLNIVKKIYRKKSLLIHPDKTDNPNAPTAFNLLKKAESILSNQETESNDYKEKQKLITIYQTVMKDNSDPKKIKSKVRSILEDELDQEQLEQYINQQKEIEKNQLQEKIKAERQLQKQFENKWEDERDLRVKNWRDYSSKIEKKKSGKKKKTKVLANYFNNVDIEDEEEEGDGLDVNSLALNDVPGDIKMTLVIRSDLKMSKGKVAAQCSHATLALYKKITNPDLDSYNPNMVKRWEYLNGQAKITLQVPNEEEMDILFAKAISLGINCYIVHDAGRTQIAAGSATVLGLGPAPKKVLDEVTGELKLY
ncbi:unnamed protein product [Candida verbasci]|uniref:peptidyl-tRNA hydrolase n=1 Tax=Candida verbasci TaxID=1227364 RepID=A0A9W4TPX1_9ASCO|nr:unnamed protein product [Candida verbasci]